MRLIIFFISFSLCVVAHGSGRKRIRGEKSSNDSEEDKSPERKQKKKYTNMQYDDLAPFWTLTKKDAEVLARDTVRPVKRTIDKYISSANFVGERNKMKLISEMHANWMKERNLDVSSAQSTTNMQNWMEFRRKTEIEFTEQRYEKERRWFNFFIEFVIQFLLQYGAAGGHYYNSNQSSDNEEESVDGKKPAQK